MRSNRNAPLPPTPSHYQRTISPEGDRVWDRIMVHMAENFMQGLLDTSDYFDIVKLRVGVSWGRSLHM